MSLTDVEKLALQETYRAMEDWPLEECKAWIWNMYNKLDATNEYAYLEIIKFIDKKYKMKISWKLNVYSKTEELSTTAHAKPGKCCQFIFSKYCEKALGFKPSN